MKNFIMINETIINLTQIQSVESETKYSRGVVKITFINGENILITTKAFDYLFEGRFTKAKEEEYNKENKRWQKKVIDTIFKNLREI